MQTDEAFEQDLRLQFSMIETPGPRPGLIDETVCRYRRWKLRRRLRIAAPVVALAGAIGLVAAVGGVFANGFDSPVIGRGGSASMHLASYDFSLPHGYHLTSADTNACRAWVIFAAPTTAPRPAPGVDQSNPPDNPHLYPPSASPATAEMAAAAGSSGGCLLMAITAPFTPPMGTANPYVAFGHRVGVGKYIGWLTTAGSLVQLTVELPESNGTVRDLGIASRGINATTLVTIVVRGLNQSI